MTVPYWLTLVAEISLALAGISALAVAIDILAGRRQPMAVMNVVWPLTALWAGPLGLWFYLRAGRVARGGGVHRHHGGMQRPLSWTSVALATTHCGAGCTLGDVVAEGFLLFVPLTLFGRPIFAAWVLDFVAAFAIGIAFQYFTIVPMRKLEPAAGLVAALKADALSLTAWQVGMYGWMAIATFGIFGSELPKTEPVFWFMMQIAMLGGFCTSYPVNGWLLRKRIKEPM